MCQYVQPEGNNSQVIDVKRKSLIQVAFIVSCISILAKLIGFARESIIAAYYGANSATDAFFFAQNMPAMIFPAVCSSLSTAFLTVYVSKLTLLTEDESKGFASKVVVFSVILSSVLSIMALTFMPYIVPLLAPGFSKETMLLATSLSRITMGAFTLTMFVYMFTAILNANKKFYLVQVGGLLCNILIIFITLYLGKGQSIEVLSVTIVVGAFVNVCVLFLTVHKKLIFTKNISIWDDEIKNLVLLSLPVFLGNSIVQLQVIVEKALSSNLDPGSISAITYACNLNAIVSTVVVASISTVLYPILAEAASKRNLENFNAYAYKSIYLLTILLLPISIITMSFSKDIVAIVYQRGMFNSFAATKTAQVLFFYAPMYFFVGVREILVKVNYAVQDTKTPMYNGMVAVVIQIVISIYFVKTLGIIGIPIGTLVSSMVSAILLLILTHKKVPFCDKKILIFIIKNFIACVLLALVVFIFNKLFDFQYPSLFKLFIGGTFLFIFYFACLFFLKCKEAITIVKEVLNMLTRRGI